MEDAATTIASAVEEQTIVVNSVFDHIESVRNKVMVNEELASSIQRESDKLKEMIDKLTSQAETINEIANQIRGLTDQFKV